jgi:hypothetical protein
MGRSPYKYKIKLSGKEKRELRQARRKGSHMIFALVCTRGCASFELHRKRGQNRPIYQPNGLLW